MADNQHTPATPEIQGATPKARLTTTEILGDATCATLEISDTLLFLADTTFNKVPAGVTVIIRMLAARASDIGHSLDGINLESGA